MPLTRLIIKNFKSIKSCDISLSELNVLIGENGTGKTNLLDAISYFYCNLTGSEIRTDVFDENNRYSNALQISLIYDLSQFVKISKSNIDEISGGLGDKHDEKARYDTYYKKIISMASKNKNKKICVELSQIKGRGREWNCTYEERLIFKSLFPIFCIDARNLDVTEWRYIWDILGELAKVSNEEQKVIKTKIREILLDNRHETSRKLKLITDIFGNAGVSVKPAVSKEFAKKLTNAFFAGEDIRQRGKHLNYYSTGTNSVKYIELLIKSIDAISQTKMKEPIILFDEPEISLHTSYLDELADAMVDVDSKLSIVVSTHSPRLIKNLITLSNDVLLFNVKMFGQYSTFYQMKKYTQYDTVLKYRVSDDHINSYFSKAILFVEGETELELFSNPYLKDLFPKLRKVDVFKAMSDKPILKIMNPKSLNSQIPYLCLIDADKAIMYDTKENKLTLKKEYFSEKDKKERYYYRNKHQSEPYLYFQRKRIDAMACKLYIHYNTSFFSCNDPYYREFILSVQQYLLAYNVFCWDTTIEGALINANTIDFTLDFLKERCKPRDFKEFKEYWDDLCKIDKVNVLRMLFNGKSDLLILRKKVFPELGNNVSSILDKVGIGGKTSGWISDYLDAFFQQSTDIECEISEKIFRKYLKSTEHVEKVLESFQKNFPQLYSLIRRLCDMINE